MKQEHQEWILELISIYGTTKLIKEIAKEQLQRDKRLAEHLEL